MLRRLRLLVPRAVAVAAIVAALGLATLLTFLLIRTPQRVVLQGHVPDYAAAKGDEHLGLLAQTLPLRARQISYEVRPYLQSVCADFTVSRKEFRDWAAVREWEPKEIDYPMLLHSCQGAVVRAEKGLYYSEKHFKQKKPDMLASDLLVIFDEATSRAYYRFTCD